ncbi:MAG: DUF1844 domain-containing protein [Acidobacteriota bacterium]|nr:DUF1844 domain-containing protein [Acidobacteriota bacterium]
MSEEQTSYKVTDRRLFNPDGSPREVPPEEKPEPISVTAEAPAVDIGSQPEATSSTNTASPAVAAETQPQLPSQAERSEEEESANAAAELPGAEDPASFASFMMSIASNAASTLGMMEHPVTGKREVDLELGKHWIDVLGMLQQKTRGNLLPQEKQILEGLLADLRMQYVSLTNSAPPKAPRTYTGRDIVGG